MTDFLSTSTLLLPALTIGAFALGGIIQARWKKAILNPILIAAALMILVLYVLDIPVAVYQENCKIFSWFMTPATICLAIAFAEQLENLKSHIWAILTGVLAGTVCSLASVTLLSRLFGLDTILFTSLLPKNVTTAIGMVLSEQAGGIGALTTAAIIFTGILGNTAGLWFAKCFRIREPIAQGVAFGTAAHIIGTAKASEHSQLMGAVSSLSLTLAGLITAVLYSFFLQF